MTRRVFIAASLKAVALAATVALSLAGAPAQAEPPAKGVGHFTFHDAARPAPDVPFLSGGKEVRLADFKGKVLLVNFWATWCGPCVVEMPSLDRLQAALAAENILVIAVSEDREGEAAAAAFLEKRDLKNLGHFADRNNKLAATAKVGGMPTTLLINAEGLELGRLLGAADWDTDAAKTLLRKVAATGKP